MLAFACRSYHPRRGVSPAPYQGRNGTGFERRSGVNALRFWRFLACSAVLVLGPGLVTPSFATQDINRARDQYGDAVIAINRGQWTEYERLRNDLDGYPLSIYLDYFRLSGQPQRVRPTDARQFVTLSEGSPLPNRFLSVYLNRAGRDRRWADFLEVMPDEVSRGKADNRKKYTTTGRRNKGGRRRGKKIHACVCIQA